MTLSVFAVTKRSGKIFAGESSSSNKSDGSHWATGYLLVFENRPTVIFQIQEILRVENISDLDKIRQEIATYNQLIPDSGELSATLFLEIEDQTHLREELLKFQGIEDAIFFSSLRISYRRVLNSGEAKKTKSGRYIMFDSVLMIRSLRLSFPGQEPSWSSIIETTKRRLCFSRKPRDLSSRI